MFTEALFTAARTLKQPRCPLADEWIRKLWYIHTMEYYSAIKRNTSWVSSNEVDETGAHYTEWSNSERERQVLHITTCIWNLERWWWWSYMQGRKGNTDVKNRLFDSVGEGKGRMIWENRMEICTLLCVE